MLASDFYSPWTGEGLGGGQELFPSCFELKNEKNKKTDALLTLQKSLLTQAMHVVVRFFLHRWILFGRGLWKENVINAPAQRGPEEPSKKENTVGRIFFFFFTHWSFWEESALQSHTHSSPKHSLGNWRREEKLKNMSPDLKFLSSAQSAFPQSVFFRTWILHFQQTAAAACADWVQTGIAIMTGKEGWV